MTNGTRVTALLLVLVASFASAQAATGVNEPELRTVAGREIVFESYTGPHSVFDTAEEIVAIGRVLYQSMRANGGRGDFFGLYSVIRAVDPTDTTLLNADIIVFEKDAGVDHIRNVRRIVAGYLEAAYGYTREQAELLAVFTTVYNAVYRGALAELARKYTSAVMSHLTAENAGMALRYTEWPGKTRLLIPVGRALAAPVLGPGASPVVSTTELTVPKVVDELRNEPGQGLEERKAMVELKETEVAKAQEVIAERRAEATGGQTTPAATGGAQPTTTPAAGTATQPATTGRPATTPATTPAAATTSPAATQTPQTGTATPAAIAEAEAAVAAKETEIQRDREAIVTDERNNPAAATTPSAARAPLSESLLYLASRLSAQGGRLQVIDPTTRTVTATVSGIVSSDYTFFQDAVVVLIREAGAVRLALLDPRTLAVVTRSEDTIDPTSYVQAQGEAIYAASTQGGGARLGRYGADLKRTALSAEAMDPASYIRLFGEDVYVSSPGGEILALSAADLTLRGRVPASR